MRINIMLDDDLLSEAFTLTGVRTRKELLELALRELIARRKKKELLDLAGKIEFSSGFDHKALRSPRMT